MPVGGVLHEIDAANAEAARLRLGLEDAVGALNHLCDEFDHSNTETTLGGEPEGERRCADGPDDCFRCFVGDARAAAKLVLGEP